MTTADQRKQPEEKEPRPWQFSLLKALGWTTIAACVFAFANAMGTLWLVFFAWAATTLVALGWRAEWIELGSEFIVRAGAGGGLGGGFALLAGRVGEQAEQTRAAAAMQAGLPELFTFSSVTITGAIAAAVIAAFAWGIARSQLERNRMLAEVEPVRQLPVGRIAFSAALLLFSMIFLLLLFPSLVVLFNSPSW